MMHADGSMAPDGRLLNWIIFGGKTGLNANTRYNFLGFLKKNMKTTLQPTSSCFRS